MATAQGHFGAVLFTVFIRAINSHAAEDKLGGRGAADQHATGIDQGLGTGHLICGDGGQHLQSAIGIATEGAGCGCDRQTNLAGTRHIDTHRVLVEIIRHRHLDTTRCAAQLPGGNCGGISGGDRLGTAQRRFDNLLNNLQILLPRLFH